MSNLSQQFVFTVGSGTNATQSVSIGAFAVSQNGDFVFYSDKLKGDGYYGASDGLHTVTYTVSPLFKGTCTMQATLAIDPVDGDWFDVEPSKIVYSSITGIPQTTTTNYINFSGNFVWVRAKVDKQVTFPGNSLLSVNYNR